jgi:alcohol dehydrogenase
MKAVLFDGVGSVKVGEVAQPDLLTNKDALVKMTHASICGSDLNILNGKIPVEENAIMGHEGVGIVEATGSEVSRVKLGDRVVISYSVQCGECQNCRNGLVVFCDHGGMLGHGVKWGGYGGTQAEYLRVPWADSNLHPIPANLTEEQAIFVGDILSTGYQAVGDQYIQAGNFVVIFGAGPVGLCAVAAARLFGPRKIVSVDVIDYRLETALRLGADMVIHANRKNPVEEVKEMTDGKGADVAVEAVGSPETFYGCFESVRPGGKISIVGVFPSEKVGVSLRDMLRRNLQIKAGRANLIHMGRLLSLIECGKLDLTPLITHRMPLNEAVEAYRLFSSRSDKVLKIMLKP